MKAAQAFSNKFLHNKCFGKRTLRECSTSGKRDNIVLIEVDCDDFGDVIILDVPESFQQKFRKKPKHPVIIDDDDDADADVDVESRGGAYDTNNDATTSNRFSPTNNDATTSNRFSPTNNDATTSNKFSPTDNDATTSNKFSPTDNDATTSNRFSSTNNDAATSNKLSPTSPAHPSNCPNVDEDCLFVSEGNIPVKLSKSKRTYSGKSISRNRYGLSSNSESCSAECDSSDSEFMESSYGKLGEQWDNASFRRKHDSSGYSDLKDKSGPSSPNRPFYYSADEGKFDHSEAPGYETNLRSSFNHDSNYCVSGSDDLENKAGTSEPYHPVHCSTEQNAAGHPDPPGFDDYFRGSINEDSNNHFPDCDVNKTDEVFTRDYSPDFTKMPFCQDIGSDHPVFYEREEEEEGGERPTVSSGTNCSYGHEKEEKSYSDQNNVIIDRQKIKETDEYKRAMEEEWASRQRQLQLQAEEAQRLRSRKRAETMRIIDNERRQKQRVEEIRETRRKEEEKLNLREQFRVEIRKELSMLERTCVDMASLLRSLGVHVGGGRHPSINEVQAAYKRACLRFHPDRSSTTDLRQQVEAEEKFKLISNMKDKFLSK